MARRLYVINLVRECKRMPLLISLRVKSAFGIESRIVERGGADVQQVIRILRSGAFKDMLSFIIIYSGKGIHLLERGVVLGVNGMECDERVMDRMAGDIAYHIGRAIGLKRCDGEVCVMSRSGDLLCPECSESLGLLLAKLTENKESESYPEK